MWTISLGALGGVSQSLANQTLSIAQSAVNYWSRYIDTSLASLDIEITFSSQPFSYAQGGTDYFFSHSSGGFDFYEAATIIELTTGVDPNGAAPDIVIDIDSLTLNAGEFGFGPFSHGVSLGGGGLIDLWTVIVHEIGHGLGLISFLDQGGTDRSSFDQYVFGGMSGYLYDGPDPNFGPVQLADDASHFNSVVGVFRDTININNVFYLSDFDVSVFGDLGIQLLRPTNGDDTLGGLAAAAGYQTMVSGLAGNDTIFGLPVREQLNGDDGDDVLIGNGGGDHISGGAGNDTLIASNAPNDTLSGDEGFDTIDYSNVASPIFISGSQSLDPNGFFIGQINQIESIIGTSFNDRIFSPSISGLLVGGGGADLIVGAFGDDTIDGGSGDDTLRGYFGNDRFFAGIGNDYVESGPGDDFVRTSNGRDTLLGGFGNDTLGAGSGGDLLRGGDQADLLLASNGNDRLYGNDGDDTMLGGGGRDTLTGGAGNDRLVGGSQNDSFNFNPASGADLIVDFEEGAASGDIIRLIGFGAAFDDFADILTAATQVGANVVIDLGGGDTITLQGVTLGNLDAGDFVFG